MLKIIVLTIFIAPITIWAIVAVLVYQAKRDNLQSQEIYCQRGYHPWKMGLDSRCRVCGMKKRDWIKPMVDNNLFSESYPKKGE